MTIIVCRENKMSLLSSLFYIHLRVLGTNNIITLFSFKIENADKASE